MVDPGPNATLEELRDWYNYLKSQIQATTGAAQDAFIAERDDAAYRIQQKLKRRTTRAHNIAN